MKGGQKANCKRHGIPQRMQHIGAMTLTLTGSTQRATAAEVWLLCDQALPVGANGRMSE